MSSLQQKSTNMNKKDISQSNIDNSTLEFDFSMCHGSYCFC
jgi:hypothetical protein